MNERQDPAPKERAAGEITAELASGQLRFFAAICASLTHELKNSLATINEYSGLLGDLSAAGKPVAPERLQKVCGKVQKQVGRSQELIARLNRFAHSADAPWVEVEVEGLLAGLCDLCDRFAALQQATLQRRFVGSPATLVTDPFALQQLVYLVIRQALAGSEGGEVAVAYAIEGVDGDGRARGLQITVEAAAIAEPDADQQARLARLETYLGVRLDRRADAGAGRVIVSFA